MVKRIFRFLYRETSALHSAAYLLGFFAVLSQILAFLRDRLLAHIFGASLELDIYYAAFRIPDFIFVAVASMVSISVLVPFIVEKGESRGESEVKEFIDNIFSFFSVLIVAACGLAFFLMPYLSGILFKGLPSSALEEVVFVSRIMLISPAALGLSNLLGSLTQAYNRFTIYAAAPLLYNAGIIFGIVALGGRFGAAGVAAGVVLGAILHALIQVPFVWKMGLLPKPRLRLNFSSIRRVVALSLPRTLALSTSHIALIFFTSLASLMVAGSISILSFSINLQSVPLTIIGVSYSLAAFPTLSRYFSKNNMGAFVGQIATTARHIIFWSLPVTALFIVLRAQIVRVLLGTGRFGWDETRLVAACLALFVVSSVFQSLLLLLMRGFYSAGKTLKPFFINLVSTLVLMLSTYVLVKLFYSNGLFGRFVSELMKVGDVSGAVVLMLPLGFSIGTTINCLLHWAWFESDFGHGEAARPGLSKQVSRTVFESFGTAVIMGAAAYIGLNILAPVIDTSSLWGIFMQGLAAGLMAILVGIAVLHAMGSRELKEVGAAIRTKFWDSDVIATDPEIV